MLDDPAYAGPPHSDASLGSRTADKLDSWRYRAARSRIPISRRRRLIAIVNFRERIHFADWHARWINANSRSFHAVVTGRPRDADIVWIHAQDPMTENARRRVKDILAEHPGVPVINPPECYNFYHEAGSFQRLADAGVSVPIEILGDDDYSGLVVYKEADTQAAQKSLEVYDGPRPGYRAFSYLDLEYRDGMFRRYRVFYVCGWVRPSKLFVAKSWKVGVRSCERVYYGFRLTERMEDATRAIARTSGLDFFALDVLVREEDDEPFVVDINIYPRIHSLHSTQNAARRLFRPHTFDARRLLGMPEPGGVPAWASFDAAVSSWYDEKVAASPRGSATVRVA
ncbi:MAG: hypothetical protein JRG82_17945 [Deltaproteobacteria bacterium]|nr:hypothetical protein [Deltaproteobacteria bacterium]